MKIEKTSLDGVLVLEPEFRFKDIRGEIVCVFEEDDLESAQMGQMHMDIGWGFSKHNFSVSFEDVIRGIHVSPDVAKLAYCPLGSIYLVAVDCRYGATFGKWEGFNINDDNRKMILIPPMFGLAHLILSEQAIFYYHWSGNFDGDKQISYRYDSFGIEWPIMNPIVSERDFNAPFVEVAQ